MSQRIDEPGDQPVRHEQFTTEDHLQRFLKAMSQLDSEQQESGEWVGTVFLMTVSDVLWARLQRAARWADHLIYWPHRAGTLSAGELVLERLAEEIYSGGGTNLTFSDIWSTLSDEWFEAVLMALRIRRFGPSEIDWEALRDVLFPIRPDSTP